MCQGAMRYVKWLESGMCGVLPVYDEYGANISLILFHGKSSVYESVVYRQL